MNLPLFFFNFLDGFFVLSSGFTFSLHACSCWRNTCRWKRDLHPILRSRCYIQLHMGKDNELFPLHLPLLQFFHHRHPDQPRVKDTSVHRLGIGLDSIRHISHASQKVERDSHCIFTSKMKQANYMVLV
jgi:hypothetical protein